MEELWDRLRAMGVLKPEYDLPVGAFGTGVEKELKKVLEGVLDRSEAEQLAADLKVHLGLDEGDSDEEILLELQATIEQLQQYKEIVAEYGELHERMLAVGEL